MYVTHNNTRKFPENASGRLEIYQRKKIPYLSLWIRHKRNSIDTRIVLKNVSLFYAVSLPKSQEDLVRVLYRVSK